MRIYKELKNLNSQRINGSMKKWTSKQNRNYFKGRRRTGS
jgi:hypothetical protein